MSTLIEQCIMTTAIATRCRCLTTSTAISAMTVVHVVSATGSLLITRPVLLIVASATTEKLEFVGVAHP
ncbi:hypothetical protein AAVH_26896 [Aphelenchoides avenae]|nr:hypothetical protein AAVH_26896 [Aphelenchus avenae]